jgi:uncharacterized protein YacL
MDISDASNINDLIFITTAAIIVDVVVIFLVKYAGDKPRFGVNALNDWYNKFGIFAVGADVLSLIIGVVAARYIYSALFTSWNPLVFILIVVLFQLFHDVFFYLSTVRALPRGENAAIDVFQDYAKENGAWILVADAAMMISTTIGAMALKAMPSHYTFSGLFVTLYSLCYILFKKSP